MDDVTIRDWEPRDEEAVVELSLRAWAPVFGSLEEVLGRELFARLRGDWRRDQKREVRQALADPEMRVWVAEVGGRVVGFAAARLHRESLVGEIYLLAVDPGAQGRGVGGKLTDEATAWLRDSGITVAMVETGGDAGHAPARRVYERAGYTKLPVARYFRAL